MYKWICQSEHEVQKCAVHMFPWMTSQIFKSEIGKPPLIRGASQTWFPIFT